MTLEFDFKTQFKKCGIESKAKTNKIICVLTIQTDRCCDLRKTHSFVILTELSLSLFQKRLGR